MAPALMFASFVSFVLVAWLIRTYNRFIKYRNRVEESWSLIDVALKRRFNLIPNLIRTVKGYSGHEARVFQAKTDDMKISSGVSNRVEEENQISESLRGLIVLAEDYPDLKASSNFIDMQNNLDELEEDIQNARTRYNKYIGRFNTLVESFPASLIAKRFGFQKLAYFSLKLATHREMPEVRFPED